jgi:hypothetical protein
MKYSEKRYAQGVRPAHIFFPQVQVIFLREILSPRLKAWSKMASAFLAKRV